ncbi:MAG TPA: folylpolyglutamate synthase/dihydrofolate synthase family protein [Vicinamibacterales bacterium]|nr:folylpolyglutamate synthase/dihydrofolate synthase family protein [Vicinamibacterales bacterium]
MTGARPAVEFLFSLERFGMKFGLENIATLCAALGDPQDTFRSIIVAGTNGKGSVTAMVDAALGAAGHASARYTSPHLQRLEERFVIGGAEVSPGALEASAERIRQAVDALVGAGDLPSLPTFFECTTAVAFDLFREARVEIAVLEVGLGGRLDSTNIVSPIAAAIVSIDFDHEEQLGSTLASIAAEKAGVIKPGIPVVCGPLPAEALTVIAAVCAEQRATLIRTEGDAALAARVASMPIGLRGGHQQANAAVALRLLDAVHEDGVRGVRVPEHAMRAGLATAVWPGRLESFTARSCEILLDAAHNPAGARALASYLEAAFPAGVTLVFGAMRDKALREMLGALLPAAAAIVCTTAPSPRAMPAAELAAVVGGLGSRADVVPDPIAAVARACERGRPVVVAGSIFLIGPVREWLERDILR